MAEPPKPGTRLSVRVDRDLSDDLAIPMRTGMTASDAVREAVRLLSDAYAIAWQMGVCPSDTKPCITGVNVAPVGQDADGV